MNIAINARHSLLCVMASGMALVKLLEQDVVIDAHDDALLKMVARLGLREAETAQAGPL